MVSRAEFLHQAGYTVLLIDLQSHGESSGRRITFGYLESRDASAALEFLTREAPGERLGVIGQSLGAAAFVLAKPRPNVSAVVLESMYPTIDQAVQDRLRLRLGWLGPILAPLLELSLEPLLGITPDDLRPIDSIASVHAPVFILAGTHDEHTTWKETRAIFDAAVAPKQLWLVPEAAHIDLYAFARAEYEHRILDFLAIYLPHAQSP